MDKQGDRLKFLDDRYAVVYKYKGYAICTLKVAVPAEHDEGGISGMPTGGVHECLG